MPLVAHESNSYSLKDDIKQNMTPSNCLGAKGQK